MEDRIDNADDDTKVPDIGLARLAPAFGYAFQGIASAWRTEAAFRQEAICAMVLIPAACFVPVAPLQRMLLVASVLLVMLVELINSSIESAIDRISTERHPLSKRAKDTGSAAVLVAIVMAIMVWATVVGGWLLGVAA